MHSLWVPGGGKKIIHFYLLIYLFFLFRNWPLVAGVQSEECCGFLAVNIWSRTERTCCRSKVRDLTFCPCRYFRLHFTSLQLREHPCWSWWVLSNSSSQNEVSCKSVMNMLLLFFFFEHATSNRRTATLYTHVLGAVLTWLISVFFSSYDAWEVGIITIPVSEMRKLRQNWIICYPADKCLCLITNGPRFQTQTVCSKQHVLISQFSTVLENRRPWCPFPHLLLSFFVTSVMLFASQLSIQGSCCCSFLLKSPCFWVQVNAWPSSWAVWPLEPNQNRSSLVFLTFAMTSSENVHPPWLQITYPASMF